ncbi:MAG: hypothetical protein ACXV3C_06900 [Actinomycetes bacterium]
MAADRHLTAATVAPVVVALGFFSLAALTGDAWFVLLAGASAGLVVASLAAQHRLDELSLCLTGPTRVAVGESVTHRLHVHNRGQVTSVPVTLTQEARGLPAVRVHVGRIPPGGRATVDLVRTATSRGVAERTDVVLESSAPLGLLTTRRRQSYSSHLVVHPEPVPPDRTHAGAGPATDSPDPVPGNGLDLAGIREWRAGDDPRRVHWRSAARRGRLVVAERGTGRSPALSLVVVGPSEAPDWEELVAVAAATARAAQLAGRPVAVTAWTATGPSPVSAGAPVVLLDWWARLGTVWLPAPEHLVTTRGGHAGAGGLVVAASVHVTGAWWQQLRQAAAAGGLAVTGLSTAASAAPAGSTHATSRAGL